MTGGVEIDLSFLDPHLGSVDIFLFFIFKPISCNSTNVSLEWGFSFGGGDFKTNVLQFHTFCHEAERNLQFQAHFLQFYVFCIAVFFC